MDNQPYVNGYLYSNGQIAVGAPCVPVILELANRLPEPLVASWVNRALFADDLFSAVPDGFFPNSIVLVPGETSLLANLFASVGCARTLLRLQSSSSGADFYVLNFSADRGYFFAQVPNGCGQAACPAPVPCPFSKALAQGAAYAPAFAGSHKPRWQHCLLLPTQVGAAPVQACLPAGLAGPCVP